MITTDLDWEALKHNPDRIIPNLGKAVGEVSRCLGVYEDCMNDPITVAYGCGGEFSSLWWSQARRQAIDLLWHDYGVTPEEFLAEIEARTDARWIYESGLGCLLGSEEDS